MFARSIGRLAGLSLLVLSLGLVAAAAAPASVQLGNTSGPLLTCGSFGYSLLQAQVASGPTYTIPAGGGVITSWSVQASAETGDVMKLRVFHPTGTPNQYTVVAESVPQALVPNSLNTFATRITVNANDVIGTDVVAGSTPPCVINSSNGADVIAQNSGPDPALGGTAMFTQVAALLVNVSAQLEPDADHDGYGDETQDGCPNNASTRGPCPTPVTPGAAPPVDKTPPSLTISGLPRSITLKKLLSSGLRFKQSSNEPTAFTDELYGSARTASLSSLAAKAFNLRLAQAAFPLSAATRGVKLKPSRKLIGKRKRFTLQVNLTGTDGSGNRTTKTKTINVR
jgi:hypothetical protein